MSDGNTTVGVMRPCSYEVAGCEGYMDSLRPSNGDKCPRCFEAMTPDPISAMLNASSSDQLQALHKAHRRYLRLAGIVSDVLPQDVVASDQKAYPQLFKQHSKSTVFVDTDCVTFMSEITGLPSDLCEAWTLYD